MFRVLQIFTRMDRGGAESSIMDIYREIDKGKIQFDFLVHSDKEGAYDKEILSLGGIIYRVRPRNQGFWKNWYDLDRFFGEHNEYKIVHMHASNQSDIAPLEIAAKHGIPVRILHSRSSNIIDGSPHANIHRMLHYFHRIACKSCVTNRLAISALAARWMFGESACHSSQVQIIKNAIAIESFLFDGEAREKLRATLNIPSNAIVLGHVGRLVRTKNHSFLLSLFARLASRDGRYFLVMIGDGPERTQIEEKVRAYGIETRVITLAARKDVNRYYSVFDVFIFPSFFEGLGRVLIEAQANGLPVLASADVIPEEAKILSSFSFLPLKHMSMWEDRLLNMPYRREPDAPSSVRAAGYDIHVVAREMEEMYLRMHDGCKNE